MNKLRPFPTIRCAMTIQLNLLSKVKTNTIRVCVMEYEGLGGAFLLAVGGTILVAMLLVFLESYRYQSSGIMIYYLIVIFFGFFVLFFAPNLVCFVEVAGLDTSSPFVIYNEADVLIR